MKLLEKAIAWVNNDIQGKDLKLIEYLDQKESINFIKNILNEYRILEKRGNKKEILRWLNENRDQHIQRMTFEANNGANPEYIKFQDQSAKMIMNIIEIIKAGDGNA